MMQPMYWHAVGLLGASYRSAANARITGASSALVSALSNVCLRYPALPSAYIRHRNNTTERMVDCRWLPTVERFCRAAPCSGRWIVAAHNAHKLMVRLSNQCASQDVQAFDWNGGNAWCSRSRNGRACCLCYQLL